MHKSLHLGLLTDIKRLFVVDETPNAETRATTWQYSWVGSKTNSGVVVNSETALSHAGVYACSKILAESVASLHLGLYAKNGDSVSLMEGDTRHRLVNKAPSELYKAFDFFSTAMLHICLHGNFYALIIRDGNRRPIELKILNPLNAVPDLDPDGKLWYRVAGERIPIRPKDVIHVKALSSDGLVGKSPITLFRESIGLGIATTKTQGSLWKNGTIMSGYLKHPAALSVSDVDNIHKNWTARYAGSENAGKTPVLQNGMDFVPLSMNPQDAMFIETARLSLQDICRLYRVPLHMVGDLERSTNNNIEHQSLEFVRDTVRPHLKNWEQELDEKLLFDTERQYRFFRFNVDSMLRGDTKSRAEYYTRALGGVSNPGFMTVNEVRALENLNPFPGGDSIYSPSMNNGADDSAQNNSDGINEPEPSEGA